MAMAEIVLSKKQRKELEKFFPLRSKTFIWRALNFKSMSVDARVIRSFALNKFGGRLEK